MHAHTRPLRRFDSGRTSQGRREPTHPEFKIGLGAGVVPEPLLAQGFRDDLAAAGHEGSLDRRTEWALRAVVLADLERTVLLAPMVVQATAGGTLMTTAWPIEQWAEVQGTVRKDTSLPSARMYSFM